MPKASLSSKDSYAGGFGVQEGFVEVVGARVKIHQLPPNSRTGVQSDPFPCVQLDLQIIDENGKATDAEPQSAEYSIGKMEYFRPGKAKNAADNDPEDLGEEVDTEGNCIYAADETKQLSGNCKWMKFSKSLEEKGFKPEVLANGFMPDLVGLKFHGHTDILPKMPGSTSDREPTVFVADKILVFPYERRAKAGPAAKASAKTTAASFKGKPVKKAPAPAPEPEEAEGDLAMAVLGAQMQTFAGKEVERKKLQTACQTYMMRERTPVKDQRGVMDQIKDDDWLVEVAGLLGFAVDLETGMVQFPEAE